MDKPKSKGDLRAQGKKRLEEFRQKKQQKGSSNKSSSTAIKALADDDKSLSGVSVASGSSVRQPDRELHENSDGQVTNFAEKLGLSVEPPQQVQSSRDGSPVPGDSKRESQLLVGKKPVQPEPLRESGALTSVESSSDFELVSKSISSDQSNGGEFENDGGRTSEYTTGSPVVVGPGQFLQEGLSSNGITGESRQDNPSSKSSNIQSEQTLHDDGGDGHTPVNEAPGAQQDTTEQTFITEIETLKRQLQDLVEQKELVSDQFAVKAKQQLEDASKVKSLIADVESIQQELNAVKNEKVLLIEEYTSSQKELQNSNRHLASELMASQEQAVTANHRASLLSEDLERAKQEEVKANAKSAEQMESMQNLVKGGEMRIAQLVEELATTQMLFHGLQDEKASLNDELGLFENELHKYTEELLHKGNELAASYQRIKTLEEDLASEQRTSQQVQELLAEKSQLTEGGRVSNEKLEALLLAKEADLEAHGDQIRHLESEKLGLVHHVEELKLHLDDARRREEGVRADLEAHSKANEEQLKQLQDEKVELSDELEKAKLLSESLIDERSTLTAAFDLQLEQLREDLRRREEETMKQGNQLLESSQELQKVCGDHAQVLKEMEIALEECRTALDRESVENSKVIQELMAARDQLLLLIEEKGQEVVSLGFELEEYKDQLRIKVEENSSLVVLLENSRGELEKTAKCASEYEAELEKRRALSDGLLEEKGSLAAEVLEIRAQYELMQKTANQHGLEVQRVRENLRGLEEDHGKLSSQSIMATDELTKLRTDKEAVQLELAAHREQVTKLEEENSNIVKLLEDTQNELQRVKEGNLLSSSDLASELDKQRVLYSELLIEKERLATELQLAIEQSQRFQQEITQGKELLPELEELQKHLKELEENHSKSLNALTVSQSEISKLKEENSLAELQLAGCKEQLTKWEDVNKDLVGVCDRQREELDAALDEMEKLLANHGVELGKFREQQRDADETKTKHRAHLQQLLSDLEALKNEKTKVALELETYKEQYRELGDENWKVASEFNKCKDQLQVLVEEKALAESLLEESKEMELKLEKGNALLLTELEDQRVRQQNILEQKVNEIETLEQQVKWLVQSQEQMARELAETQKHSQVLEIARLELLSNVEGLSKQVNHISVERDVLQSDVEVSKRQLEEVVGEKQQLILKFEDALENWKVEKLQLSSDLEVSLDNQKVLGTDKAHLGSEMAELTLKMHDLGAQRVQLAMEVVSLKEMIESSDEQRAHLMSEVEGKCQLLQTLAEEKSQLDSELHIEREKATLFNDHLTQLAEDLRASKLKIEELELETARLRVDFQYSQTQVELLTEEKNKLTEDVVNHLSKGEQSQQLHEEIQAIRQVIASKDGQVDQLTTQCKLLQTELEVSNMEKRDLAQDLASLKHQLQQISEQKPPGGHVRAQSVACKQRVRGNEEIESESGLNVEKVAQDLPVLGDEEQDTGEDTQEPAHDVQSVHKLEEISQNLGQELRETLNLVGYVRLDFENQAEQLKKALEELEGKQHQLDTTFVRVDELDSQVKDLTENAANLQAEKDTVLEALYAAQEELRLSEISLIEEKALLEDHLRILEEATAAMQVERDDVAGKLASLEQSHTHLSERALQDSKENLSLQEQVAAFEVRIAEHNTELGDHKDMVAQSNFLVQSLVQKLEDVIRGAFPEACQELLSSQCNKDSADYHNSLASKLHSEITLLCHQLQDALAELSETKKQLQEAEDQSMRLAKERTIAVEAAEQVWSQSLKAAEEKEKLESSLKRLETSLSAVNERAEEQAISFANLQIERDDLAGKLASLEQSHNHLSERALQESNDKMSLQERIATFEVQARDYHTEWGNHKDMVTQSNLLVQSLVQKLEDVICDAFPTAGQELLSSQHNKLTADYHNSLASRLQIELTAACQQLRDAHVQLSERKKQLQEAEAQSLRFEKESSMAVEATAQIRSQLLKAAEEKEELETLLKRLEAIVSAENVRMDERAIASANQASEVEDLVLQIQSLNKQLENANAERENLQTRLAQAEQKLSATREKLSLAVNKGKAVVQKRDAWKLSLAEKSKELEMLVVGHQQELQDRDAALNIAERKIVDLTASLEDMVRLEIQLHFVQKMMSTAEQVFMGNEDLVHSLLAALDNTVLPDDWRSSELAKKILWITGCVGKLLQELATNKEEMQAVTEHASALASTVEKFEARITALVLELDSVKHEKDDLVLTLEDGRNQFQLERDQMMEEKVQLTGTIRQQDTDIAMKKREKEDLSTRLQEQAKEIVKLDATASTLFRKLSDCHETISPIEIDTISAQSSLDFCKCVVKLLIDNHNLTVLKLKQALGEVSLLSHSSQEAVKDGPFQSLDEKTSTKEISDGFVERVEEALASLEQQAIILVGEQNEKNRLQLELTQKEQRLNAVREKLSAAVSKGKSLVQQRDSMKQALMDKDAELETLATVHKEELQSKELLLQEASDRLTSSLEHAAGLERDFVSFKTSVASNPDPSLVDRLSEMERQFSETQQRANAAESEAENSKIAAAGLFSNLELAQTKLDNLVEEVNSLTKDKNELVQQLESAGNKYRFERQELTTERTQLISEISNLKADLAIGKEEREKLVHDYTEVSDKCGELRSQIEEVLTARAMLLGETETLQQRIAELEMALDSEAHARMKLESDTEAVVARIRNSTRMEREPVMERSFEPMTSIPHDSQSSSQLDLLSTSLVVKYEAALQEVQELSKQNALLSESQQTMMENASSEREMFKQLQQRLAAKDLELSEMHKKLEGADSRREKEEDASKGFIEEVGILKEELAKARSEKDTLQSELVQVEQKGATTREKLSLAIKKGKGVAQQRDLLKQTLSEQQSLGAHYKDELQNTESALKKATDEVSIYDEKVQALEHNVNSLRTSALTLEQELRYKDSLLKKIQAALAKGDFPTEWQSKDITEKLEWLVATLSNAERSLIRAGKETDALKKASAELSFELTDAQTRANREQESRSVLGVRLEETLAELEQTRNRIGELETLFAEIGGFGQQTEQLSREVLDLNRSVQQKQAEVDRAEEAVNAWVKRSEESEKYIQLCKGRISELEQTVQESVGAHQQIALLNDKIARLEEAVQQKEAAVKAMEASRGKAVNKLTLTTNKFRELYRQSEGLVVELERMQQNLQDKDAEIVLLKEEVVKISIQSQISQEMLESKKAFQLHLEKLLESAVLSGAGLVTSPPIAEKDDSDQLAAGKSDEERCIAHVNLLRNQLSDLTVQSQARRADMERKEVRLQGMRKELDEVVAERTLLNANLQREQIQSERLKAEIASMQAPLTERGANQAEEIEEVQVGKRLLPINVPTPHVRGARRPNPIDVTIDVDSEMTQSLVEFDDKGHGFKSLASSRFMPGGTRAIGEQIDRLCVVGGKVLMRQPAARLMVTLYWLAIHIWMVFLISAAHI